MRKSVRGIVQITCIKLPTVNRHSLGVMALTITVARYAQQDALRSHVIKMVMEHCHFRFQFRVEIAENLQLLTTP